MLDLSAVLTHDSKRTGQGGESLTGTCHNRNLTKRFDHDQENPYHESDFSKPPPGTHGGIVTLTVAGQTFGHCQTKGALCQKPYEPAVSGRKLTPLGKRCGAIEFEDIAAV